MSAKGNNPWLVLIAVSLGMLMAVFGIAIVNIVLPTIAQVMDASLADIQWVLIAYLLAMTGLVPIFGRVSDVIGRKRLFVAGILIVAVASVLAALSPSVLWLIGARVIQGVGGGLITSNALAIITDTFPSGKRGTAMGVQAVMISGGAAIAPTVGGVLATNVGWQAVFLFNVPMALVAAVVAMLILPPLKSNRTAEPIDWLGATLLFGSLTPLLLGLTQAPSWGWTSGATLSTLGGGLVLALTFVAWETRSRYPVVDLSLFRIREFAAGQMAGMFATMTMATMMLILPFYWQGLRGYSAQTAGLLMLPMPMLLMVTAPLSGRLSDRWGARWIASVGLVVLMGALLLMSLVTDNTPVWSVLLRLTLIGTGLGMFMAPNNNAVMSSVPPQRRGIASGLLGTFRYTGQSTGVAFAGTLFAVFATAPGGFALQGGGLPGPDTIARLGSDPVALAALRTAFTNGMHGVFLAAVPVAGIGALLSVLRGSPGGDPSGQPVPQAVAGGTNGGEWAQSAIRAPGEDEKERVYVEPEAGTRQ